MAENVNFPLDQGSRTSAFQGLKEASQKTDKPPQSEDKKKELSNSDRARESQESQRDIASAERRELQANRQEVSKDAKSESRNARSQGPAGANKLSRVSGGSAQDPEEPSNEQSTAGDSLNNRDRVNEVQDGNNIDSIRKATARAAEDATSQQGSPSIRDTSEAGRPTQGRERLEEDIKNSAPSLEERAAATLEQSPANDAKVQQRLQDKRVEEARVRVKNEPALRTPPQKIKPVEKPKEPLREAVDNNPLRGPRPSELKDESDASAVETERGQNVSNLI
jgi:hypothetical protein